MKKKVLIISLIIITAVSLLLFGPGFAGQKAELPERQVQSAATENKQAAEKFSYHGQKGVDALTLLKEKADVKEKQPGFVLSINGREAQAESKEFWSFYVNGKMAEVGAADYVTKDTDVIEWKIDTY